MVREEDEQFKRIAEPVEPMVEEPLDSLDLEQVEAHAESALADIKKELQRAVDDVGTDVVSRQRLEELRSEVDSVEKTFLGEIKRIAGVAFETLAKPAREYKKKRREAELSKVDNPKIIKELLIRIKKVLVNLVEESESKDGHKKRNIQDLFSIVQDKKNKLQNDIYSNNALQTEIKQIVLDFQQAKKTTSMKYHWNQIENFAIFLVYLAFDGAIAHNDVDKSLEWWPLLPEDQKEYRKGKIIETVISSLSNGRKIFITTANNSAELIERNKASQNFNESIKNKLANYPDLLDAYQKDFESLLFLKIMTVDDWFLSKQPDDILAVYFNLPPDLRKKIIKRWNKGYESWWPEVMKDPNSEEMIEVILECPIKTDYRTKDKDFILFIKERFSAEEISKADELVEKTEKISWDKIFAALRLSKIEGLSADKIKSIHHSNLTKIAIIALAYKEEEIVDILSAGRVLNRFTRGSDISFEEKNNINSQFLREYFGRCFSIDNLKKLGVEQFYLLQTMDSRLYTFNNLLNLVPEKSREKLFSCLLPEAFSEEDLEKFKRISEEQIDNYVKYVELLHHDARSGQVGIDFYFKYPEFFSGEKWTNVLAGIEYFKQNSIVLPVTRYVSELFMIYEKTGDKNNESGRDLLGYFGQDNGNIIVGSSRIREQTGFEKFEQRKRSYYDVIRLFELAKLFDECFDEDKDLWPDLLKIFGIIGLTGVLKTAFDGLIDKKFKPGEKQYFDKTIIEGSFFQMFNKMTNISGIGDVEINEVKKIKRIKKFSREQKEQCLELSKLTGEICSTFSAEVLSVELVSDVENGEVAKILNFAKQNNLKSCDYLSLKLMAGRPDCIGLYYYFISNGKILSSLDRMVIKELITLKDMGLPVQYLLAEPSGEKFAEKIGAITKGNHVFFVDIKRVALATKIAFEAGSKMDFIEITRFANEASDEDILRKALTIEKYFENFGLTELRFSDWMKEKSLENMIQRLERFARLNLSIDDIELIGVLLMSDEHYNREFGTDQELIDFVDQFNLSAQFSMKIREREELEKKRRENMTEAEIREEKIKELFSTVRGGSKENLEIINNVLHLLDTTSLNLQSIADYLKSIVNFSVFLNEMKMKVLNDSCRVNHCLFPVDILVNNIFPLLLIGMSAEEIMDKLDNDIDNDRSKNSKCIIYRVTALENKLREDAPEFFGAKQDRKPFFARYRIEDNFELYRRLQNLSEQGLKNLKMLACEINYGSYVSDTDNLFLILESENFPIILGMAKSRIRKEDENRRSNILDSLLDSEKSYLKDFCESIDEQIVEEYLKLPKCLVVKPVDAVFFLKYPAFPQMLEFARRMSKVFGESFSISAREMLLFDIEKDLENIEYLHGKCLNPLSKETLLAISSSDSGEFSISAKKMLSIFNNGKIDFNYVLPQLKKMDKELAIRTIFCNIKRFGWNILNGIKKLFDELKISKEDLNNIFVKLFEYNPDGLEKINFDFDTAKLLLDNLDSKCIAKIKVIEFARSFSGTDNIDSFIILLADSGLLLQNFDPFDLPDNIKNNEILWNYFFEIDPQKIVDNCLFLLNHVYNKEKIQSLSDKKRDILLKALNEQIVYNFVSGNFNALDDIDKLIIKFGLDLSGCSELIKIYPYVKDDPVIRNLLTDRNKLGLVGNIILKKLVRFIENLGVATTVDVVENVRFFLNKLRRTFLSSDSSLIDKRVLFLDKYDVKATAKSFVGMDACGSLDFKAKLDSGQTVQQIMAEDLEDILIESSNEEMRRYYKKQMELTEDVEERKNLEEKIKRIDNARKTADKRNRENQRKMTEAKESGQFAEAVVPQETSVSQVGPSNVTLPILKEGTLCDGLLGAGAKDEEENLATHIVWTRKIRARCKSLKDRLVAYGNPHGSSVFRIYGDITKLKRQPYGLNGGDGHFCEGEAHYCIEAGIPSSEITSIVIRENTPKIILEQKKAIATAGFFIPLIDLETEDFLWTEEEFDEMKAIYFTLDKLGYSETVSHNVYDYYSQKKNEETKHGEVIRKAHQFVSAGGNCDLAVLVDFLKNNDLNTKDLNWYKEQSFESIIAMIKKSYSAKSRRKVREKLFEGSKQTKVDLGTKFEKVRKPHELIDDYFEAQISYLGFSLEDKKQQERGVSSLMFGKFNSSKILETAKMVSETKVAVLKKAWEDALNNFPAEEINKFKEYFALVVSGSSARGEAALGSDVECFVYIDDLKIPEKDRGRVRKEIEDITSVLFAKTKQTVGQFKLRCDSSHSAFIFSSDVLNLKVDLDREMQTQEPREIMEALAVFSEEQDFVNNFRKCLYQDKNRLSAMERSSFIPLELGFGGRMGKKPFIENFNKLFTDLASGQTLERVKHSLQRTINFKLHHLVFQATSEGKISEDEFSNLSQSSIGKIDFLVKKKILNNLEAQNLKELLALVYKIRFVGEFYSLVSEEGKIKSGASSVSFQLDSFSYEERERLVELMKYFRDNLLYK